MKQLKSRYNIICIAACVLIWLLTVMPFFAKRPPVMLSTDDVTVHWDGRSQYYFLDIMLDRGVYIVRVDYLAAYNLNAMLSVQDERDGNVKATAILLPAGGGTQSFRVMSDADNLACRLDIEEAEPSEQFTPAEFQVSFVFSRGMSLACYSFYCFLLVLFATVLFFYNQDVQKKCDPELAGVTLALMLLMLVLCVPMMINGVPLAKEGDTGFHIQRLAHLGEAIANDPLQLRMQSGWHNGYGYPVAFFYGELFMLPAAALYAAGLPLYQCYNLYFAMMGVILVLNSYFGFKTLTGNRQAALFGCTVYVTISGYLQAFGGNVGHAMAVSFLPVLVAGFYAVITDRLKAGACCLIYAFTSLINTHIITATRAFIFCVLFFLAERKLLFKKERITALVQAALITLVLNLWFIVPFLDYYLRYDLSCEVVHLLSGQPLSRVFLGITSTEFMLLAFAGYCFVTTTHENDTRRHSTVILALYGISLLVQTNLMPYRWMYRYLPVVYNIIAGGIQHLQRYGFISSLLVLVWALYELRLLIRQNACKMPHICVLLFIGLTAFSGLIGSMRSSVLYQSAGFSYSLDSVADDPLGGGDNLYLFKDIHYDEWFMKDRNDRNIYAEGVVINNLSTGHTRCMMDVSNTGATEGHVELPILNYHGYIAEGEDGVPIRLTDGVNHRIRVEVPSGYEGRVTVCFVEPWYWRFAECISLVFAIYLLTRFLRDKRRIVSAEASA